MARVPAAWWWGVLFCALAFSLACVRQAEVMVALPSGPEARTSADSAEGPEHNGTVGSEADDLADGASVDGEAWDVQALRDALAENRHEDPSFYDRDLLPSGDGSRAQTDAVPSRAEVVTGEDEEMDADSRRPTGTPLYVVVVSDLNGSYGSTTYNPSVHRAVERVIELRPDLILSTGDMVAGQRRNLNYRAMWEAFHEAVSDPFAAAGLPFAVTPGNHDGSAYSRYVEEREIYVDEWTVRRPDVNFIDDTNYPLNYAFEAGGVLFISLDSTRVGPLLAPQMRWLRTTLEQHGPRFDAIVLFGHVPLYGFAQGREREVIGDPELEALLNAHEVTAFISGHHHAYYPGRRDALHLVGTACLGNGPRRLIGVSERSPVAFLSFRIYPDGTIVDLDSFHGAGMDEAILRQDLPPYVGTSEDTLILRDDLDEFPEPPLDELGSPLPYWPYVWPPVEEDGMVP